jgi:hypothetical protein
MGQRIPSLVPQRKLVSQHAHVPALPRGLRGHLIDSAFFAVQRLRQKLKFRTDFAVHVLHLNVSRRRWKT